MTAAVTSLHISRVLVALDTSAHNERTLESAARLAAGRNIELVTLFIEDRDLLHLAEFPFASEIESGSGAVRSLDSVQMARMLRHEARRLAKDLDNMSRRLHLRHSHRVVRGSYLAEAMAAAAETDILFLSRHTGLFRDYRPRTCAAVTGRATAMPETIWIWHRSSPASAAALAAAAELAAGNGRLVLLPHGDAGPDAGTAKEFRQRGIDFTVMPGVHPPALAALLRRDRGSLLVVHAADLGGDDGLTQEDLEKLSVPVAIVF